VLEPPAGVGESDPDAEFGGAWPDDALKAGASLAPAPPYADDSSVAAAKLL
jgi:hypothetical protein